MKQPNQITGYKVDKSTLISLEKGKIPPQAVDLEEVVLGAMMIDKKGVDEVIDILSPDAFYKEAHQLIFEAIFQLFEGSEPVDWHAAVGNEQVIFLYIALLSNACTVCFSMLDYTTLGFLVRKLRLGIQIAAAVTKTECFGGLERRLECWAIVHRFPAAAA